MGSWTCVWCSASMEVSTQQSCLGAKWLGGEHAATLQNRSRRKCQTMLMHLGMVTMAPLQQLLQHQRLHRAHLKPQAQQNSKPPKTLCCHHRRTRDALCASVCLPNTVTLHSVMTQPSYPPTLL